MCLPQNASAADVPTEEVDDGAPTAAVVASGVSYDFLLSMPLFSLTWEKVQALQVRKGVGGKGAMVAGCAWEGWCEL